MKNFLMYPIIKEENGFAPHEREKREMNGWMECLLIVTGIGLQFSMFHCLYGMKVKGKGWALGSAAGIWVLFVLIRMLGGEGSRGGLILLLTIVWCLLSVDAPISHVLRLAMLNVLILASAETFLKYAVLVRLPGDMLDASGQMLVNEVVILLFLWLKQLFFPQKTIAVNMIKNSVYVILFAALGILLFLIYGIIYALGVMSDYRVHFLAILTLCVACVVVTFFAIGGICLIEQRERLRMHLHAESEYRKEQRQYYLTLIEKEEETRAFRHDIVSHLLGIRAKIESGQIALAMEHIDDLYGEISQIQRKLPDVGNEMINAILNYYLGDDEIHVTVTGRLQREVPVKDTDLCVIISNIVKNAAEAVRKTECEKEVCVEVQQGEKTVLFKIENTWNGELTAEGGRWRTVKKDNRNHGFGLMNVEKVIKNYDGEISFEQTERVFKTKVLLRV